MVLDSYCESKAHEGVYSKNRIIDSLIKSGQLSSALKVFDEMPLCDVVTYNLLISGHARCGFPKQALYLYAEMLQEGIRESPSTFSTVLGFCSCYVFFLCSFSKCSIKL